MRRQHTTWFRVAFVVLFLAACGKHALTFATGPAEVTLDARGYWEQSISVLRGDWWLSEPLVDYRTPLYPYLIGSLRFAFGENALFALLLVQHALQIATGLLMSAVCWTITRRRSATLVAYAGSVLCITRPWFANVVLTESLFTFCLTATVAAVLWWHVRPSFGRAAAFGLLLGVTILVRPVPQYLGIPLLALFALQQLRGLPVNEIARHAGVAVLVLCATLTPWCIRNWMLYDDVFIARLPAVNKWQVCFQTGTAAHLPLPQSPAGQKLRACLGRDWTGSPEQRYCYAAMARLQRRGLSEEMIDELVTQSCIDAVLTHPGQFGWRTFKRFVNYWRCFVREYPFYSEYRPSQPPVPGQLGWRYEPIASAYEQVLRSSFARHLRWNEFLALSALIGTAVLSLRRRTRAIGLSLAVVFLYFSSITAAVELENYRYRMVLEPCMILAIAAGIGPRVIVPARRWLRSRRLAATN